MRIRILLVLTGFLTAGLAQISTADLAGTITDETGGVIRNVTVTLTNSATGARRTSHTDAAGRYSFEAAPPGLYRVTAQTAGFQTEVAPRVELTVGEKAVLNLRLKVGQIETETVVTAGTELVETRDAALSSVMDNRSGLRSCRSTAAISRNWRCSNPVSPVTCAVPTREGRARNWW